MGLIIGIDIGGSTTKIVGLEHGKLQSAMKVRADDPVTSAYGALGRFISSNGWKLSDVDQILSTGVGSSHIGQELNGIRNTQVDEFLAIGYGGQYLTGVQRAIIVSMGTGTALVKVVGSEVTHLGGSGVGGGTLLGLSDCMFHVRDFQHIVELAEGGNLKNIDLSIGDISKQRLSNMNLETTASNFGKVSDMASSADLALGVLNLVFQSIGMFSVFAARSDNTRDIILTGNLTMIPYGKSVFDMLEAMYPVKFTIPEHADYATAIGAALSILK